MNSDEGIVQRYGFYLPQAYREMCEAGLFNPKDSAELFLTDLEWMSSAEICDFEPLPFQIGGLIPFAKTARVDLFCWYLEWSVGTKTPVIFCPRDAAEGFGYAEDFVGFIYRILLEEFSGSWLIDSFGVEGVGMRFRQYAEAVSKYLPEEWSANLIRLAKQPLKELESGVFGVLTRQECENIIEHDLCFSHLNQKLKHYV